MAMTGYYKTLMRPRTHRPLSMLKYDPVGTSMHIFLNTIFGTFLHTIELGRCLPAGATKNQRRGTWELGEKSKGQ